jgi:hypothetical protein
MRSVPASGAACALLVLGLVLTVGEPISSQDDSYQEMVVRLRDEGFNRSRVMEYASYLSDVIGPRLSGSDSLRDAQEWARVTMDTFGLTNTSIEPFGEHGVNWDVEYVSLHMLEPDYQPLFGYPVAFTAGTGGPITARAVLVDIKSRADLEIYQGLLQDAVVLSTPPRQYAPRFEPEAVRHDADSLKAFADGGVDLNVAVRRTEAWAQNPPRRGDLRADELEAFYRAEGVAAVLVAAQGGDGTLFVTGRHAQSPEAVLGSLPTVSIAAEHYGRIYRLVERGVPVTLQVDIRVSVEALDQEEYNVLGEIVGTDLPHEVVMIGAHLDSFHTGTGATDNAAGVASVLEAMRILRAVGATPRRTIRAALWSYEEGGLRGSRSYVARHFGSPVDGVTPDYENFSVYFNLDNGTGQIRGVHQQGNLSVGSIFDEWMRPFNDLGVGTLSTFSNMGSDHLAFDEVGLPGFQFVQDRIDYRTRTHHTNMDMFEKLLPDDLKINAVVLAGLAYQAAQMDERVPRKPPQEP